MFLHKIISVKIQILCFVKLGKMTPEVADTGRGD